MVIQSEPVAFVEASRDAVKDDDWGGTQVRITLAEALPTESLDGVETFSHVEVLFYFDRVSPEKVVTGARHPRNNTEWPKIGIFAQRGKGRPNRIGSTICRVLRREGRTLLVAELDAIDGTPVLDIKPVMKEFLPKGDVHQPEWSTELMREYWRKA